jgi:ribose transport system substrate-binding protein
VWAIRNAGRDEEMFLTGVGGSQDAMEQIKEGGLYRATFLYNPNMAATAVNMARLIEGHRREVREVRVQLARTQVAKPPGARTPGGFCISGPG